MSHEGQASHNGPHNGHGHGQEQKLVYMANQIATFFGNEPEERAVAEIEGHIRKFWDPRMRTKILEYLAHGGDAGLSPRALAAVRRLE